MYRASSRIGIPGPEVLSIGIVDETAYMIQAFVDGDNGVRQYGSGVRCLAEDWANMPSLYILSQ